MQENILKEININLTKPCTILDHTLYQTLSHLVPNPVTPCTRPYCTFYQTLSHLVPDPANTLYQYTASEGPGKARPNALVISILIDSNDLKISILHQYRKDDLQYLLHKLQEYRNKDPCLWQLFTLQCQKMLSKFIHNLHYDQQDHCQEFSAI